PTTRDACSASRARCSLPTRRGGRFAGGSPRTPGSARPISPKRSRRTRSTWRRLARTPPRDRRSAKPRKRTARPTSAASDAMDILGHLLSAPPESHAIDSPRACFDLLEPVDPSFSSTVDRAAAGGFLADRLGYAFLAGYRAALARLAPSLSRASLCATESAGAHPRAIATRLQQSSDPNFHVLTGEKTFATLASVADVLLVVASRGEEGGRNRLVVARIPASRPGITI